MKDILITSSALIVALFILRTLFRNKLSCRVQYALWGLVLIRLLIPFSFPASDFSVLTVAQPVETAVRERLELQPTETLSFDETPDGHASRAAAVSDAGQADRYARTVTLKQCLPLLWKAGMVLMTFFFLSGNLYFWIKLRKNRQPVYAEYVRYPVYLSDAVSSPCLFGLLRPSVYLTSAVLEEPERLRYVLAHEITHAKHLDNLWPLLRCVCLTVYWFDPLVWAAALASKTDCELACDEGVLSRLDDSERIAYGQTLLTLVPVKRSNPMLAATTMVSGKKRLKDRITRIAQKPQRFAALTVAVMLLLGAICAFTFTGAAEEKNSVTYTDHIADNIYVPVSVEEQMKTYVQRLLSEQPDKEVYDDWRIQSASGPYIYHLNDTDIRAWRFNYALHAIPSDSWKTPDRSDNSWVFFESKDFDIHYRWSETITDMEPDSVEFLNLIAERLSEPDTSISDAQYVQNLLDTIMNSNSVFMNLIMPEEKGGGAYTVSPDLGIGRYWQIWFTEPGNFVWTSADPPDKTIASELLTVSDPGRHNILNFRNGSDLVQTISNGDERWFRAATQTDINDVFYLGFGIFQFMRFWYDEAELESLWSGIVIPDDGRSREEIALAWAQAHEEVCLHVTEGSKYARTFVDVRNVAAYVPGPERFSDMDAETVIPFEYETVLVLENPDDISAMSVLTAGNTVEYDGSDAPSGAYKYYRNGYLHLSDDGWSCNGVGTGW